MNASYVRIMLEEAERNLRSLLNEVASDPAFSEIELSILLNEVYGPLNTAWHGRDLTDDELAELSEEQYYRLRSFPVKDIIMDGA